MKIMKQIGILFFICWISVVIESILPFAFPASVIGLLLLFVCLAAGVLKVRHVQEKSDFLLSNMAFFFIPAGVSMMNYLSLLKETLVPLLIICIISTLVTFAVTAYSIKLTLILMNWRKK